MSNILERQLNNNIKNASEIKEQNETEIIKNIQETISEEFIGCTLESNGTQEVSTGGGDKSWLFTINNKSSVANGATFSVPTLDYITIRDTFLSVQELFERKAIERKANGIIKQLDDNFLDYKFTFGGVQDGFGHVKDMYMFTIIKEGETINGVTVNVSVLDFDVVKGRVLVKISKHKLKAIKESLDNNSNKKNEI